MLHVRRTHLQLWLLLCSFFTSRIHSRHHAPLSSDVPGWPGSLSAPATTMDQHSWCTSGACLGCSACISFPWIEGHWQHTCNLATDSAEIYSPACQICSGLASQLASGTHAHAWAVPESSTVLKSSRTHAVLPAG